MSRFRRLLPQCGRLSPRWGTTAVKFLVDSGPRRTGNAIRMNGGVSLHLVTIAN